MTQPQDKMRAEFEEKMLQQRSHSDFSRDDGGYFSPWMQAAWTGWRLACAQQSAQSRQDVQGDKPLVVRLAEDFAEDCILAGYVTTGADSHKKLMAAAQQDALDADGHIAAWMTEDGERVVSAATMAGARKDGGAILSSMKPYSVALIRVTTQGASNV